MNAELDLAMSDHDLEALLRRLEEDGIDLMGDSAQSLRKLGQRIIQWNRMVNLVSRKDLKRLVTYHFCDSASLLPLIRPARQVQALDVGGSNGLPGLVLAAASPHVRVKIVDSRLKRKGFLEEACRDFGPRAKYVLDRVDSQSFEREHSEMFDLIVARAVTRLKLLLKWCMPLLKPGGCLVAYKGSRCFDEIRHAEAYFWSHGGHLIMVVGSPWADQCNPLRLFAIARKRGLEVEGSWDE
jgi:16S rRNA (guanine527-N7)-methyltransferase